MSRGYQPTEEQLALVEERKHRKLLRKQKAAEEDEAKSRILPREWLHIQESPTSSAFTKPIKVMTWNLLAQCLIRRELFPTSDCLKAAQREHMLYREILSHQADEVDRIEKLFPVLEEAGYALVYATGPRKKHGCLIAYRPEIFSLHAQRKVLYDEQEVRQEGSDRVRRGGSFFTKNIASLVALRRSGSEDDGIIVATTHLFWHPAYTYERSRQIGILLREVVKFQEHLGKPEWPCIVAGDFNFQPNDATYSLLVGDPLLPGQTARLDSSRVVHKSIDPDISVPASAVEVEEEEGEDTAETDPDRVITSARPATDSDGLLTDAELVEMCKQYGYLISVYDEGLRKLANATELGLTFGSNIAIPPDRRGAYEPVWTSYTHYWKTVLDYIFVLDPRDRHTTVLELAKPHLAEKLDPGLPRNGVSGSDHISLSAQLTWPQLK